MKRIHCAFIILLVAAGVQLNAQSAVRLYAAGRAGFDSGEYTQARDIFLRVFRDFPQSPVVDEAGYYLGITYYYLNQYDESLYVFERLVREFPQNGYSDRIPYWMGLASYRMADYASALDYFTAQLAFPDQSYYYRRSLLYGGMSAIPLGFTERSRELLSMLADSEVYDDTEAMAVFQLGMAAVEDAEYRRALGYFSRFFLEYPVQDYSDEVLYRQFQAEAALEMIEDAGNTAVRFAASYGDSRFFPALVFSLADLNPASEALQGLLTDLVRESDDTAVRIEALARLAELLFDREEFSASLEYYRQLSLVEAHGEPAFYNMGLCSQSLGDMEAAAEYFIQAAGFQGPYESRSRFRAGLLYGRLGSYEDALEQLQPLITSDELDTTQWYSAVFTAAEAALKLNRLDDAAATVAPAMQTANPPASIILLSGDVYRASGDYGRALTDYVRVASGTFSEAEQLEAEYRMGYTYHLRGEHRRAVETYDRIIAQNPQGALSQQTRIARSVAMAQLGGAEDAVEFLEELVATAPDTPEGLNAAWYAARILIDRGEYQRALGYLDIVIASADEQMQTEARFLNGYALFQLGRYNDAAFQYSTMTMNSDTETASEAAYRAGIALNHGGRIEEALGFFRRVTGSLESPYRAAAFREIAFMAIEAGDWQSAMDACFSLLGVYPADEVTRDAFFTLGEHLIEAEELNRALELYRAGVDSFQTAESRGRSMYGLGETLGLAGDDAAALDTFTRYLTSFSRGSMRIQAVEQSVAILNDSFPPDEAARLLFGLSRDVPEGDLKARYLTAWAEILWVQNPREVRETLMEVRPSVVDSRLNEELLFWTGRTYLAEEAWEEAEPLFQLLSSQGQYFDGESLYYTAVIAVETARDDDAGRIIGDIRLLYGDDRALMESTDQLEERLVREE
jgi:tetratricopeptide (TPR) repeat protein